MRTPFGVVEVRRPGARGKIIRFSSRASRSTGEEVAGIDIALRIKPVHLDEMLSSRIPLCLVWIRLRPLALHEEVLIGAFSS